MKQTLNMLLWTCGAAGVVIVALAITLCWAKDEQLPVKIGVITPMVLVSGGGWLAGVALFERLRSRPLQLYNEMCSGYRRLIVNDKWAGEATWEAVEKLAKDEGKVKLLRDGGQYELAEQLEEFGSLRKWM